MINLKTAKYTSDSRKGQALDTKNIRIVDFWGNGNGTIVVDDMYLTNNEDYSPMSTSIDEVTFANAESVDVHTLSGQLIRRGVSPQQAIQGLPRGIYIVGGRKMVVR